MNASPIGPRHPAMTGRVLRDAHHSSPTSTEPAPPGQITLTIKPTGLLDSFDLPGVPTLTSDIDSQVLKHCSLPTLGALVQGSKSCSKAVQEFIKRPGEPGGAHDTVRSLRLQRRLLEAETKSTERRIRFQLSVKGLDPNKWGQPDTFQSWAAAITRKQIRHLHISLDFLPHSLWAQAIASVTTASQWQTLFISLYRLEPEKFIDHGGNALRAIHYGPGMQRLELGLNSVFSVNDAFALLGYLRATPQCKSVEINPGADTCIAIKILAQGLPETDVDEFKIGQDLKSEQQSILGAVLCNPKLQHFSGVGVSLNGDIAEHLSNLLKNNSGLRSLLLAHNNLTENDAISLAQGIASHPALESLNFSNDDIGIGGWAALGEAIAANANLANVRLPNSDWTDLTMPLEEAVAFIAPLSNATRLLHLDWQRCPLTVETLPYLHKLVQNNPAMFALGCLFITDMEIAKSLTTLLADISHPLTVDCRGSDEVCAFFATVCRPNPLLHLKCFPQ
ncbi:MAG: hypothetical protein ACRYGK_08450 [Janthinobacterium lividum]